MNGYYNTIHSIRKRWWTECQFFSNSKLRNWTTLLPSHFTLKPVKYIKYQDYQQSRMFGSQGTHVFSWGLFRWCRRSVSIPQWQHSTTVQRKRKLSLNWYFHCTWILVPTSSFTQLLMTPKPSNEQGWHLRFTAEDYWPWLVNPSDGLTAMSAPTAPARHSRKSNGH